MCVIDTTIKVASKQAAFEMGKHSIAQRAESLSLLPFSLTDSSMLSSGTLRGREPLPQAQQSRSTIAFLPFYITVIATAGLGLYVGFSRKQAQLVESALGAQGPSQRCLAFATLVPTMLSGTTMTSKDSILHKLSAFFCSIANSTNDTCYPSTMYYFMPCFFDFFLPQLNQRD